MADPIDILLVTEALKDNLESLLDERRDVKRKEREIELKISALHQSLSGLLLYADAMDQTDPKLASLVKSIGELLLPSSSSGTLTEACRNVLRTNTGRRMSALDVRKALEGSGFDFSGYTSNPLSSIHTTLRRLKENEDVKETIADGTKFYQWIIKPKESKVSGATSLSEMLGRLNISASPLTISSQPMLDAYSAVLKGSPELSGILNKIDLSGILKDKK